MAKGDKITVISRLPEGLPITGQTVARQNGRTVFGAFEKDQGVTWFVVDEKTRGGTLVRRDRYAVGEIVSITEEYGE